ncbi:MAG: TonB family protein [Telmatospirillum sp.]|nr:TonB family protein [Telmatospirillum sp.]
MAMRLASSHFDPRAAFVSLAAHGFAVGAIAVVSAGLGPTPPTVEPARVNYVVIEAPLVASHEATVVPPAADTAPPPPPLPPASAEIPQPHKPVAAAAAAKTTTPKAPTPKARPLPSHAAVAASQPVPDAPSARQAPENEGEAAMAAALSDAFAIAAKTPHSTREAEPARDDRPTAAPATAQAPVIREARFRVPPSPPIYPRRAIELDLRGTTILRALVDADGTAAEIVVWASSGLRLLDDAALAAARRWRFEPAREGAVAVAAWVEVPVRFELR